MKIQISDAMRPSIPEYGIAEKEEGMITWEEVNQYMDESKNYWINTTKTRGNAHARPIWGIWLENIFYFGGGQKTQNIKNLQANPHITVHTESGEKVVIIEGIAETFHDDKLHGVLSEAYKKRYDMYHPPPFWRVIPKVVFTWNMGDYVNTPTKFVCRTTAE